MNTWVLIDTETDGLYAPIHAIEVAAQKFDGLCPVGDPIQVFINHGIEIPFEATEVHGYTTEFIEENGLSPIDAYARLRAYIGNNPVVSHYLQFDWNRVLMPELMRLGIPPIGRPGFCTWLLSRRALPEHLTHKLDHLRDYYDLACTRPHSALGDVEATTDLLQRIIFPRLTSINFDSIKKVYEFATMRPLLRCKCLIQDLDFETESRRVAETRREEKKRKEVVKRVHENIHSIPSLINEHELIEEEHDIIFMGRKFLFTGKMAFGLRSQAQKEVQLRGGLIPTSKHLSNDIDYLILGEDKEAGWTRLLHGGKLTSAFLNKFQYPSSKLHIVREEAFRSALLK